MTEPGTPVRDPHNLAVQLQSLLLGAEGLEPFLAEVARYAADAMGAASCGITVRAMRGSSRVGAASDEFARRMEEVQYEFDDGPCLTSLRDGKVVVVTDIASDPRWPEFNRRGREVGAGMSVSVPMIVGGETVGALNLYSRHAGALVDMHLDRARTFADQAAGAVALAVRLGEREDRARHLETALSSRSTIDQAIGIVMALTRSNAVAAFEVLRTRSQHSNVKLRDIALQIIADVDGGVAR